MKPPAVALLTVGGLSLVASLVVLAWLAVTAAGGSGPDFLKADRANPLTGQREFLIHPTAFLLLTGGPVLLQALLAILTVVGGLQMLRLRSRAWGRAAAVLAMLPCTVGFVLGLPVGVWALRVLAAPEVKRAFAGNRRR